MAKQTKSPLWFRVLSTPLYKLGIITVWRRDVPDFKWSITLYKPYGKKAE